ncbi:hypothetical protein NKI12_08970 [Mesorhizobium australicum]|uniref:Uncharacterized protein n=1 Tax=Mesorhizobium australicum TaxID=536018 RepID=A0ACC6STH4_9HYPH
MSPQLLAEWPAALLPEAAGFALLEPEPPDFVLVREQEAHVEPKSSREVPGPEPRKDRGRDTRKAVAETPDKTNDWDRDAVHGDGDTIDIQPEPGVESK